jgi:hypothetical protein
VQISVLSISGIYLSVKHKFWGKPDTFENSIISMKGNQMFEFHKEKNLLILSLLTVLMSACGSSAQNQADISTAVAQTVVAQNSLTDIASLPTLTPAPSTEVIVLPDVVDTSTPAPILGAPGCTVAARLAGETPPDETLLKPGQYFWKTWTLENTGTCTWDATYKLIYNSGDLMDGLTSYPLPGLVAPGETGEISIYLKTPATEGTFTGYWSIQTPWNASFGVGPTSNPFYVKVVVSDDKKLKYEITSVTYKIVRNPEEGCPVNVRYTVNATITTNGPYVLEYYWEQSDGNESARKPMIFTEAGSITVSREWMVGRGDSPNRRWMQIVVTDPILHYYDKAIWPNNCP